MQVPVIDTRQGILHAKQGEYIHFQPFAWGNPYYWQGTRIARGFTVDPLEGITYGASINYGVYIFALRAMNEFGWSRQEVFTIGVQNNGLITLTPSFDVDVDVVTRKIYLAGTTIPAVMQAKFGDTVLIRMRLIKNGQPLDLPLTLMEFNAKETEPERIILAGNTWRKNLYGTSTTYDLLLTIDDNRLKQVLANYEGDFETGFEAPSELKWSYQIPWGEGVQTLRSRSINFPFRFVRELKPN